jgi:putative transposase
MIIGGKEVGYRRLRCPRCGFEGDRDAIGRLNIRKRALKIPGNILGISGHPSLPPR